MKVPFLDLKKINQRFDKDFKTEFQSFLDSGHYILGDKVNVFEKEFAIYCGVEYCIGVGNGLDALFLILKGYKELGFLCEGDEILVSANTYIATVLAIKNAGFVPVLIEPNPRTHNIDPTLLNAFVNEKSKAILATHLYGQLAETEMLKEFSSNHGLLLLTDSAQAHGAEDAKGNKAGSLADASGFSFYPSKNLGALGDGGAVTTNDVELAECIRKLRNYGTSSKYVNEYIGFNSRLDEFQAAILSIKLKELDKDNERRRGIAKKYINQVTNTAISLPKWNFYKNHVFHLFVVSVEDRVHFQKYVEGCDIQISIHYPIPMYKQKAFEGYFKGEYPITDKLCNEVVSLPISPVMNDFQVDYLIEILNNYNG